MSFITQLGNWLRKISTSITSLSVSGRTITYTRHNGDTGTIQTQDTTYNDATQSTHGLMSAEDKATFDAIPDTYALRTGSLTDNPIIRISADERVASFMQHGYTNDTEILDVGWDWNNRDGAVLGFRSSSHPTQPGYFQLTARDETDSTTLQGTPSGDLTWGGHKVITVVDTATSTTAGAMSAADKSKLDGVTAGAEPNQNAFSNIKVGSTTVAADGKTDTLELVAGSNITLTPDATNDKVTIAATDTVYTIGTASGSGNAITALSISGSTITPTLGKTFSESGHTHSYLPLSGGTLTGALTFANNVWNTVGDDVKIGDFNKAGLLGVMGANGTTGIAFCKKDDASSYKTITYDGTNLSLGGYTLLSSVPANAKFTDTVTTASTSGSGNAVTSITASNGALTVKKDSTFSLFNHTHHYAGSSSAGGAANSLLNFTSGTNGVAEHDANKITTNGLWYYTSNGPATSLGASVNDGALYSQAWSANWVAQIAQDYRNGNLFVRGRNNGTWKDWQAVLTNNSSLNAAKLTGTVPASCYTNTVYTHPTSAGNKHIPAGGSKGQILRWSAAGTAAWGADNDTVYTHPTTAGNKHIPSGGAAGQFLKYSSSGTAVWAAVSSVAMIPYCTSSTDAGKAAKVASVSHGSFSLVTGAFALLYLSKGNQYATGGNGTAPTGGTINIASTGAKGVIGGLGYYNLLVYDGTNYIVIARGA